VAAAVGIASGTTNAVVAVREGGELAIIDTLESLWTTLPVVALAGNAAVLVSELVKRRPVTDAARMAPAVHWPRQ
jgi:molecular chaperone DnaK (HSP70)